MIPVTDIPDVTLFAMIAAMKEAQETLADLTRPADSWIAHGWLTPAAITGIRGVGGHMRRPDGSETHEVRNRRRIVLDRVGVPV